MTRVAGGLQCNRGWGSLARARHVVRCDTLFELATVKKGPPPPTTPSLTAKNAAAHKAGSAVLKARNAAGKPARASPSPKHQRPHRVHVGLGNRIAEARHHRAELEEEARRHHTPVSDLAEGESADEKEEEIRITGLNFDEERRKRGRQHSQDDDEEEDAEEAVALGQAAAARGFASQEGAGKYFQDLPEDHLGDLSLTNPNEMKRLLGPSVRFAMHAMLIAEDRLKNGMPREDAVELLAQIYLGVADRAYANKALREFGCGTGIIDIYPLEVIAHLLEHVPAFFTKVCRGNFLAPAKAGYLAVAGDPIVLEYDPHLRIRGFAIKGGEKPGYLFEPTDPPGKYHLTFRTAGVFKVLISAIAKNGFVFVEEIEFRVREGDAARFDRAPALQRERSHEREGEDGGASERSSGEALEGGEAEPAAKKDDLTFHFPRRI